MAELSRRRSALQFALDVTGGPDIVYRVAVYLHDLVRNLEQAPGLIQRARIDILLFDAHFAGVVSHDELIGMSAKAAAQPSGPRATIGSLTGRISHLPYEGGGFHTFILLTNQLEVGWEADVPGLQRLVGSVTGLCCGPRASADTAMALSKEPGGVRIVNPLDVIRKQFDSIADWLIASFADRPIKDDITTRQTIRYDQLPYMMTSAEPPPPEPTPAPVTPPPRPQIQPARWRVIEPSDPTDPTEHLFARALAGTGSWVLAGASRRGKLHAHEGSYRDDAFMLGAYPGWHLAAVADGAGSCRLSRVGARVATEAAIAAMVATLQKEWDADLPTELNEDVVNMVMLAGIAAAHSAVYAEAASRNIPVRDLSSTFLLLAHGPVASNQNTLLGYTQIGDGLGLYLGDGDAIHIVGEADKGYYSGETIFLPGTNEADWKSHTNIYPLTETPRMVLVMTDGVADDLIPYARQVPTLVRGLDSVIGDEHPDRALLDTLGYEKRDSADDRTLVMIYQRLQQQK
jgi:Protein phosphatase 2C